MLIDAQARWVDARRRFGDGAWVGKEPLEEAYEEAIDGVNYCDEEIRRRGEASARLARVRALFIEAGALLLEEGW